MIKVDAQRVADLISSLECNHIVVKDLMAKEYIDWDKVAKWREWRDRDYKELQAMGIPVYNPQDDKEEEDAA